MKLFRKTLLAAALLTAGMLVPESTSGQMMNPVSPRDIGRVGHGHPIHGQFSRTYFPQNGPYGYGNYGYADRWRSSGHWRYYPEGVYRQGLQYQYVPGHFEWQQQGNIFPNRQRPY